MQGNIKAAHSVPVCSFSSGVPRSVHCTNFDHLASLTDKIGNKHKPNLKALNESLDTYADNTDATSKFAYSLWILAMFHLIHTVNVWLHFVQWRVNSVDHPVVDHSVDTMFIHSPQTHGVFHWMHLYHNSLQTPQIY